MKSLVRRSPPSRLERLRRSAARIGGMIIVAALSLELAGCKQGVSLSAIQAVAAQASASKTAFDAISEDFYDSCVRTESYLNAASPTFVQNVASDCADNQRAAQLWQEANGALLAYVASLGDLATDKTTDYGISSLASEIGRAPGSRFTSTQQAAVAGAVNGLISGVYLARRKDTLATIMTQAVTPNAQCAQGCLTDLIALLKHIATEQYATQLSIEDASIYAFYQPNISTGLAVKGLTALNAFGFETAELTARQSVAARRAAIATYTSALDQIASTHEDVAKAVSSNDLSGIEGVASAFITTYSSKVTALKKAYP